MNIIAMHGLVQFSKGLASTCAVGGAATNRLGAVKRKFWGQLRRDAVTDHNARSLLAPHPDREVDTLEALDAAFRQWARQQTGGGLILCQRTYKLPRNEHLAYNGFVRVWPCDNEAHWLLPEQFGEHAGRIDALIEHGWDKILEDDRIITVVLTSQDLAPNAARIAHRLWRYLAGGPPALR